MSFTFYLIADKPQTVVQLARRRRGSIRSSLVCWLNGAEERGACWQKIASMRGTYR